MVDSYAAALRIFPSNGIDVKTAGNTKILSSENGTRMLFPINASFNVNTLTGTIVTPANISIGTNAPNYNNILSSTAIGGLGILDSLTAMLNAGINTAVSVTPNTDIYLRVSSPAIGGTSFTINCNLMAYYR